jgi:hypothetical protein
MVVNIIDENNPITTIINPDHQVVVSTMMKWGTAFSAASANSIVALYSPEASLWGTFSSVIRKTPESISDYFNRIFIFANREVTFNDCNIRLYGDTAIGSGLYTFSLVKAGQKLVIPARYSFTYIKQNGRWLIVEHHSSVMPEDL